MRKIILSICLCLVAIAASAQTITASTGGKLYTGFTGVDYVFICNDITTSEITYNDASVDPTINKIEWYKYKEGAINPTPQTGVKSISPDGDTGYILKVDDKQIATIWVVDYKPATLTSIEPENDLENQCKTVNLLIAATVPELTYQTPTSATLIPIQRNFTIEYTTLKWDDTSSKWENQTKDTTITISPSATLPILVSVPSPYCTTTFTLSGDQYAEALGITSYSITSSSYTPSAVICHLTSIVTTRDVKNEADEPKTATTVSGSAPLPMQFFANGNEPIPLNYRWEIFNGSAITPFVDRSGTESNKNTTYTFSEAGTYKVKITVSNTYGCSYSDSITVTVDESEIQVPNVFTPNGDGYNDEFRVAYKSIIKYEIWVYSRWGRLVYNSTNPQKGWDGNINGKKAAEGAYFYIIKAVGSDAKKYKLKGDINLLRGKDN